MPRDCAIWTYSGASCPFPDWIAAEYFKKASLPLKLALCLLHELSLGSASQVCCVHCLLSTLYCLLCTLSTVHCLLCAESTVHCLLCALSTVYCLLCTVYCLLCAVSTVYCPLSTVYCTTSAWARRHRCAIETRAQRHCNSRWRCAVLLTERVGQKVARKKSQTEGIWSSVSGTFRHCTGTHRGDSRATRAVSEAKSAVFHATQAVSGRRQTETDAQATHAVRNVSLRGISKRTDCVKNRKEARRQRRAGGACSLKHTSQRCRH